jgi:hypothetical protein
LFHLARIGIGPLTRWLALHAYGLGPGVKLGGVQWRLRMPPVDVSSGTNRQGGAAVLTLLGLGRAWARGGRGRAVDV